MKRTTSAPSEFQKVEDERRRVKGAWNPVGEPRLWLWEELHDRAWASRSPSPPWSGGLVWIVGSRTPRIFQQALLMLPLRIGVKLLALRQPFWQ